MITGHVFIAVSLDGYIARTDGDIGWLIERDDPAEDHGYADFIHKIDVILMGRCTFESVRHFDPWPYSRRVVVLSNSLTDDDVPKALRDKVQVMAAPPAQAMARLEAEGAQRVYVDGGRVIQSFLAEGLIDDMVITRVPVLLGGGRSLFGPLRSDVLLVHDKTVSFPSGLVQSHYRIPG